MSGDWSETFFSGLWLEAQRAARPPERSAKEAAFVERALRLTPGSQVLDVPCGDGRLALELAARGHRVTGVDVSPILEDAGAKARERRLETTWTMRRGGVSETRKSSIRLYTYRELTELLHEAGFADFEAFGSLDGAPYALGRRLRIAAIRGG